MKFSGVNPHLMLYMVCLGLGTLQDLQSCVIAGRDPTEFQQRGLEVRSMKFSGVNPHLMLYMVCLMWLPSRCPLGPAGPRPI